MSWSSWMEYSLEKPSGLGGEFICEKDIILEQFGNLKQFISFAEDSLLISIERKKDKKELEKLLLD